MSGQRLLLSHPRPASQLMGLRPSGASDKKPPRIYQPVSEFTQYPVRAYTTTVTTGLALCGQLKAWVALQVPVTPQHSTCHSM